ncbi:unnamed protein product [Auanema sp. JU1783]|nr:unnamed protein product [Auanema sp. JU1783]
MNSFISGSLMIIILFSSEVTAASECCRTGGFWSEWNGNVADCADTCGGYGTYNRTRTCLSEADGCPCTGETEQVAVCDRTPCNYPRYLSCAEGYSAGLLLNRIACKKPDEELVNETPEVSECAECCPPKGIWSEWKGQGVCSDTCGSFGVLIRNRKCLSEQYNCPCEGETKDEVPCNPTPCTNSTSTCNAGFGLQYNDKVGLVICAAVNPVVEEVIPISNCCDPERLGLWNSWSEWSLCSATCGMCGKRIRSRTCASQMHGCACIGSNKEEKPCGNIQCEGEETCCSPAVPAIAFDGSKICTLNSDALTTTATTATTSTTTDSMLGSWSVWKAVSGSTCNDTCGSCGRLSAARTCLPAGATCLGEATGLIPCNPVVCAFPRSTCCTGYKKHFDAGLRMFDCVPEN